MYEVCRHIHAMGIMMGILLLAPLQGGDLLITGLYYVKVRDLR